MWLFFLGGGRATYSNALEGVTCGLFFITAGDGATYSNVLDGVLCGLCFITAGGGLGDFNWMSFGAATADAPPLLS